MFMIQLIFSTSVSSMKQVSRSTQWNDEERIEVQRNIQITFRWGKDGQYSRKIYTYTEQSSPQYTLFFIRNRFIRNWYKKCQNFKKFLLLSQAILIELRNCIHIFQRKIFFSSLWPRCWVGLSVFKLAFVRLPLPISSLE